MKTVLNSMGVFVLLILSGCSEGAIEVDGVRVTEKECRDDLRKLEARIDYILDVGKVAVRERWNHALTFHTMHDLKSMPSFGLCGKKSEAALDEFTEKFIYALVMEREDNYASLTAEDKEKRKAFWMRAVTETREKLDSERQKLRGLASKN